MSTIVEEFVISMGLDPSDVAQGAQRVRDDMKRVREAGNSTANELEAAGKRAANFFASLRTEVVGLFLAFAGAKGLKDFIGQIISGDAAVGRLAKNLGVATGTIGGWQGAVQSVGGAASDADAALRSMADAYQNWIHLGTTGHDQDFAGLGLRPGDLQDPSQALLKLSKAAEGMPQSEFRWRAERLGLSDSMISLLAKGRTGVSGLVDQYQRLTHITEEDAEAEQKLEAAMNQLQKTIHGLVRPEVTKLAEGVTSFLGDAEQANLVVPVLTGLIGSLGVAATVAAAPWVALAADIAAVVAAYRAWKEYRDLTPDEKKAYDQRRLARRDRAWQQLKHGDLGGVLGTWEEGFHDLATAHGATAPAGAGGGSNADQIRRFFEAHGFNGAQANGILASIGSEDSGLDPAARNPSSGAYGIGQWLSAGRIANFKRVMGKSLYGSSLQDQLAFMLWEMRGGDAGRSGAAVMGAGSSMDAAKAMIGRFYRPGPGLQGDLARASARLGGGRSSAAASSSQSVTVSGPISIYVPSGDPKAIARGLKGALDQRMMAVNANTGIGS